MGAATFVTVAAGRNAREAFATACDDAAYEYGHGGYTGTIAEKHEFRMISHPSGATTWPLAEARAAADKMLDEDDRRISDKFGPAGCFALADGRFLFFGLASS